MDAITETVNAAACPIRDLPVEAKLACGAQALTIPTLLQVPRPGFPHATSSDHEHIALYSDVPQSGICRGPRRQKKAQPGSTSGLRQILRLRHMRSKMQYYMAWVSLGD